MIIPLLIALNGIGVDPIATATDGFIHTVRVNYTDNTASGGGNRRYEFERRQLENGIKRLEDDDNDMVEIMTMMFATILGDI